MVDKYMHSPTASYVHIYNSSEKTVRNAPFLIVVKCT